MDDTRTKKAQDTRPYEQEATDLAAAIRKLATDPKALDDMESYLSYHFANWLQMWCQRPKDMVHEFQRFAKADN